MRRKIVVIVGPNASGKSELGVKLAKQLNGEIISADSRQVYKGLDIGSGKITKKEMRGVRHHCLSIADPKKVFTALDFKKCAEQAIRDIASRKKTPIIVGGTGFYIDAALGRVKLGGVPPNRALRKKLAGKSAPKLLKMLKKLNPERAKNIEQKNPRRLIRAIEIALKPLSPQSHSPFVKGRGRKGGVNNSLNGFFAVFGTVPEHNEGQKRAKPSELRAGGARMSEESLSAPPKIVWLCIKRPPEELKRRIHARLLRRFPGIIREVKKLHQRGLSWKRLFELGLEYRYASLYLRGKISKDEMTKKIITESRHYAKRQMTWFKKNKEIRWGSNSKAFLKYF